jgi:hypothetical protein
MPRGDGTGPLGMGPMIGRGVGFCAPGYANSIGCGFGLGQRRGFRRMFYATGSPRSVRSGTQNINGAYFPSDVDEKEFLRQQVKFLEDQLDDVKKRLEEFKED